MKVRVRTTVEAQEQLVTDTSKTDRPAPIADPPTEEVRAGEQPSETPAKTAVQTPKPHRPSRPAGNRPARVRDFVRTWTVKIERNGEVETLRTFEITSNANHELNAVPLTKLTDYTVKTTGFELIGRTLRLQFTWSWKNAPFLKKIETFVLTLSRDGRKLNGTYKLSAAGSSGRSRTVWGE